VTIILLTAVVKGVAVLKELVVAWRFGISDPLDAYVIALLVNSLAVTMVAGPVSVVLIPTFISVREQEGPEAEQRLLASVTAFSLALLLVAAAVVTAGAPFYLPWLASGFGPEKLSLALRLTYLMLPMVPLSGLVAVWGAVLNSRERFALTALAPIITPVAGVLFLLALKSWGVFALPAGMVCGAGLEALLLGAALRREGLSLRPRWHGTEAGMRQVVGQFTPTAAGTALRGGSSVVDRAIAATLPAGSVAALSYGGRITATLLNVVGMAVGTAVTPYFSKMVARRDWGGIRHTLRRYLLLVAAITLPLAALFFFFSEAVVRALYQRGSFGAADTQLVARVQAFYALQIPFFVANAVVARLLTSLLAARFNMWAAVINLVLNVVLNLLLVAPYGVAGIALATSSASVASLFFLSYHLLRILRRREASAGGVEGAEAPAGD